MDKELEYFKRQYETSREAGDWKGMQEANDGANQWRNAHGQAAEFAYEDIDKVRRASSRTGSVGGGASGGGGGGYTSPYGGRSEALVQDILDRPAFSYDYRADPTYQRYQESYTRAGERAMQDTLGQVSARTGGLASSYAGAAAQQTYDGYMTALNDQIPALYQAAYGRYMDQQNADYQKLNMLQGLEGTAYARYRDQVGDAQWRENRDLAREQWDYQQYTGERDYASRARQEQYARDADQAMVLASVGDYSGYSRLWSLSPEAAQRLVDDYAEKKRLTREQAAWELAGTYAQYGDFSKLSELGVDTRYLESQRGGYAARSAPAAASSAYSRPPAPEQTAEQTPPGPGIGEHNLAGLKQSMMTYFRRDDAQKALDFMEQSWDNMSREERAQIEEFLTGLGYGQDPY